MVVFRCTRKYLHKYSGPFQIKTVAGWFLVNMFAGWFLVNMFAGWFLVNMFAGWFLVNMFAGWFLVNMFAGYTGTCWRRTDEENGACTLLWVSTHRHSVQ